MLEITGRDIGELNDSDLRSLIGLLCEAELRVQGLPPAGVTYGGNQNARDGGIDVRVELSAVPGDDEFIPRASTIFQIKKPDMSPSEIKDEMRPNGELRESIKALADKEGVYIIVSGTSSTSDSMLTARKRAMFEAISNLDDPSKIKLDYYDQNRIATWVRSHPSMVLWIREKTGNPVYGWQPYGNWAEAPGGVEEEYLLDDQVRLFDGTSTQQEGMNAVKGINILRSILFRPGSSVRLAGLSGVGKTRLVQALFDERIGDKQLNRSQVFYTDVGDNPIPDPRNFVEKLLALRTRAILVVDNCSPELHGRVNSLCTASGSLVSLITIEYDVREDQPQETEVFRLEPASESLIEEMINKRFVHVSPIDARTIAEFSGGNARIAIALANTVQKGETLADLRDEDLFKRLFNQRHDSDNQLLKSAEACSLVYSFDCRTSGGSDTELKHLGSLAGRSVSDLHADVAKLKRRNLVQQRNYWRAVLPHAIANKLAKRALENIPFNDILNVFENRGSERLLKSFSRRLSYLHESEEAVEIADKWLSKDGLLGDVSNLNNLDMELLKNIAPVKPEATLQAIERAANSEDGQHFTSRGNRNYVNIIRLLCSLAYDPELFDRSVNLLCRFALSEDKDENVNSIRNLLKSLFFLYLSGTHASPEQRLKVIRRLIASDSEDAKELGLELLRATLKTSFFTSSLRFDFGARPRDTGFRPQNKAEHDKWFSLFIDFAVEVAISDQPVSKKAKSILADNFRGLWTNAHMHDELESAANEIIKKGSWKEGWVAVQKTVRFDSKEMDPKLLSRLQSLGKLLKPMTLLEQARLYALAKHGSALELPDTVKDENIEKESDRYRLIGEVTRSLGEKVAADEDVLITMLPELISTNGPRLFNFGQGLADGCSDPLDMWERFRHSLASIGEKERNYQLLRGFLNSLSEKDTEICNRLLDEAVADDILGTVFPFLQTAVEIDSRGVERIRQALDLDTAPIRMYNNLAYVRTHESIDDEELADLLKIIAQKTDGLPVAIEILHMKFHGITDEDQKPSESLVLIGKELLSKIKFDRSHQGIQSEDYVFGNIIEVCFNGESAKNDARIFCNNLAEAISEYKVHAEDFASVYEALIKTQPIAFLDCFYGEHENFKPVRMTWSSDFRSNPLSAFDENIIIDWCDEIANERYPTIASAITPFRKNKETNRYEWTPLAHLMIENSPVPEAVLDNFKHSFSPSSWSGSRAAIMVGRLPLISSLKDHENPAVVDWAVKAETEFEEEIRTERKWEIDREQNKGDQWGFE